MPAEDSKAAEHHKRQPLFASAAETFVAAVKAFNLDQNGNQDSATLATTLADSVIICKIGDGSQAAPHDKASVLQYLTSAAPGLKGCLFSPKNQNNSLTKIHGVAKWVDNDGSRDDTLKYDFDFDPQTFLITKFFAGNN
jgi:hypothetical protein